MESVLRGLAIYVIVLVVVRISGRRALSEMTAFDLVLILIISETTQQALMSDDFSITNAAIVIITFFAIDIGLSYLKEYWRFADKLIEGKPTLLVGGGARDERAMKRARVSIEDVMATARRQHGLERFDQIKHAVLENDGKISIVPAKD